MARFGQVVRAHRRACLVVALLAVVCAMDGALEFALSSRTPWQETLTQCDRAMSGRSGVAGAAGAWSDELTDLWAVWIVAVNGCGLAFLVWVAAVRRAARSLGVDPGPAAARKATWGFVIPFVSLWWPYSGLRAFDRAIDPARLPEEPPRPNPGEHGFGYREAANRPRSLRAGVPRPPLELWWALYVVRFFFDYGCASVLEPRLGDELSYGLDCATAIAAALVVLRIDARLGEHARRASAAAVIATTASRL